MSKKFLSLRDFKDRRLTGNERNWVSYFIGPKITALEFEFTFKIHLRTTYLMIGLMRPDHPKGTYFCQQHGQGWAWYSSSNNSHRYKIGGSNDNITQQLAVFRTGDQVRWIVNKKKKMIQVQKNNEAIFDLYTNVDLPDEIHIAISRYTDRSDIELISFTQHNPMKFRSFEELSELEKEGIHSIVENFGDLKIPLKNQTLNLWKFLLIHSEKKNLIFNEKKELEEYTLLKDMNLCVDEKIILCILLGIKVLIRPEDLIDYYFLFKSLGMKKEMKMIIELMNSSIESFKDAFLSFRRVCLSGHENEVLRSWFDFQNTPQIPMKKIFIDSFDTSISLALFNQMKDNLEELQKNPEYYRLDVGIGFVLSHVYGYSVILDPFRHNDFDGMYDLDDKPDDGKNDRDDDDQRKFFLELREGEAGKKTQNLILVSSDGKEFGCHKELLVYRMGHFKRMLEFRGIEREQMLRTDKPGRIVMEDMNSKVLETILDYVYGQPIEEDRLDVLVNVLILAQKYLSTQLIAVVLNKLTENEEATVGEIEDFLHKVGHVFFEVEEVVKLVVPQFSKWSKGALDDEKIRAVIRRSFDTYQLQSRLEKVDRIDELEKKFEEQVKVNEIQKNEIEGLQNQIQELKKEMEEIKKLVLMKK